MIAERLQTFIHQLEVERGVRWLNYAVLTLVVLALAVRYDTHCYRNFSSPEAMDAAQVARNLAEGNGFSTQCIRPFSIYLVQKHNHARAASMSPGTNATDFAQLYGPHPDLANAPLYPVVLAGLFKISSPSWKTESNKSFWGDSGRFLRYKPEFAIAIFNQVLLLVVVLLTFLVAKAMLDTLAAWLSAILILYSDELWRLSVSGLPTMLLLVIFLGLIWCLVSFERLSLVENPKGRRQFVLAVAIGLLTGLGMLTRYSFGWVIIPLVIFFIVFGGARRIGLALTVFLVFAATVSPWLARNFAVSGTLLGTAGYAVMENSYVFSGARLMQSLNPEMFGAYQRIVYLVLLKLFANLRGILSVGVPQLGGGWVGILFLAGLLLGLRNPVARRLRYFALMCLGVFIVTTALGQTPMSTLSPEVNTENQLILLTPLAVIFGVAFFVTLLNQMEVPFPQMRYIVIGLLIFLVRLPFTLSLLPPENSPSAYPPYYPPDIQKISTWIKPNELVMSDIPWAVAWYGDRQCSWTTINCNYEFVALNDFIKPVNGLYLTLNTLNAKLLTECVQGGVDNWSNFSYKTLAFNQLPSKFPLQNFPLESLGSGLFLADRQRW
jgi:hypothetical protein